MKRSVALMTVVLAAIVLTGCGRSGDEATELSRKTAKSEDTQLKGGRSGDKATEVPRKTAKSEPAQFQDCLDAAFISLSQNRDFKTAIAFYDKAIALRPDYGNAYNNRGCLYVHIGEVDRGIKDFDKAIALNPKDAMAYANRGIAHGKKKNQEASKADLDKARALDPKVRTSAVNLRISDVSPIIKLKIVDGKIVKR